MLDVILVAALIVWMSVIIYRLGLISKEISGLHTDFNKWMTWWGNLQPKPPAPGDGISEGNWKQ
jgi:hypothetical protein